MRYQPRPGQPIITNTVVENPRCNVWAGMGFGKTAANLEAIQILKLVGDLKPGEKVLVLGSLRIAQSVWPDEIAKFEDFADLTMSVMIGSADERLSALLTDADIYTMNYENLPWLNDTLKRLGKKWPFVMVIADESTKLKGFRVKTKKAKRSTALARHTHTRVRRFVNLTGTPSPNGLKDLWGQNWFIDGGERLGRTYTAFTERWFQSERDGMAVRLKPLYFAQDQIEEKLTDVTVSLDPKDYFDLKEPIEHRVRVDLPPAVRVKYTEMEKTMYIELEKDLRSRGIEAVNAAARTLKCLQIANGAVYPDPDSKEFIEVHKAKLEALEDIIEEAAGEPVLVAYKFKSDLARLQKHFKYGRVLDKKIQTPKDWNAGKIPLMFAHPASAGHGLNLQDGGNILVFFALDWNLEEHDQIKERLGAVRQFQSGRDRATYYYYITARNTIEDTVFNALRDKKKVQDALMEALKRYKEGK